MITAVVVYAIAVSSAAEPPEAERKLPQPSASEIPPIYVFLEAPTDIEAFLKKRDQPDFVLMPGKDSRGVWRTPGTSLPLQAHRMYSSNRRSFGAK